MAENSSSGEPDERGSKDGWNIVKGSSAVSHSSPLCQEKVRENGHRALSGTLAHGFQASSFIVPAPREAPGDPHLTKHCSRGHSFVQTMTAPPPSTQLAPLQGTGKPGTSFSSRSGPTAATCVSSGATWTPAGSVLLTGIWKRDDKSSHS